MSGPAAQPSPPGGAAAARHEARLGTTLAGRYQLIRVIGTGGMGAVYEAQHVNTGKRVAVKLLASHLSKDLKLVARFRREAMAASRLDHENCVQVDDFGEDHDGTFYIAMELIVGHGLADELRKTGPMAPERVARIGVQLLSALDAAHVAGVLHRDLKPQNVMLTQKLGKPDMVKVVDFGIAKITNNEPGDQVALTLPGTIFGTPEYMSPEQARGETLDARSDIYSAAVVLWHMLLGRSPFRGTSVRDTLLKVFAEEAPPPTSERPGLTMPPGFEGVLRRGLRKAREERWSDAASFAEALMPFVTGPPLDLPPRARPGLGVGGAPPPPTLDKMPAVRDTLPHSPAVPAGGALGGPSLSAPLAPRPAAPVPAPAPAPAAAASTMLPPTSVQSPPTQQPSSMPPTSYQNPPTAFQPPTEVAATPMPLAGTHGPARAAPPPSSQPIMPAPRAAPAPAPPAAPSSSPAAPAIPAGAPKAPKVVTVDAVKRQTNSGDPTPAPMVEAPAARASQPISPAALIVITGSIVLLGGFAFGAWKVFNGDVAVPSSTTSPTTQQDTSESAPKVVSADPEKLKAALASDIPLDPLARDAALGRAERAVAEGKRGEARLAFEEAVAADPTAPAALIGLGTIAMQQHDWVTARDCFGKLMEIDRTYRKQFGPMYARAKRFADQQQSP